MSGGRLSHLDAQGAAHMVDVGAKDVTQREARAEARVQLQPETVSLILSGDAPKGDVFATVRIAGIMAAKRTHELIPLCHPLAITRVAIEITSDAASGAVRIESHVALAGQTGVEMEALTAVSVAALTLYDMVKAVDRAAVIGPIRLLEKSGGTSGRFVAGAAPDSPPARRAPENRPKPAPRAIKPQAPRDAFATPGPTGDARREHLRGFMAKNRIRAAQWARDAGLSAGTLYAYLHGRTSALSPETEERLARAVRASVEAVFGGRR